MEEEWCGVSLHFDIFCCIASSSVYGWKSMLAIPQFGRFTLTQEGKKFAEKCHFRKRKDGYYYIGNLRHNTEFPSINSKGDEEWYRMGEYHRNDDLPAIIFANGARIWYEHGKWKQSKRGKSVSRGRGIYRE
eukprot:TRINITY_DN6403_c0_g1_i1.p1 TRINITY_DN6403_c0_g1~~TRINITY_DN6403_c0_g1_i1.p1  ORF type:complete len:132 (-),score=37.70 TRINITY_DN6403_c0_g1_i1:261-656(-)